MEVSRELQGQMHREALEALTTKELSAICKQKGIPHYHGKNRFRKEELIDAILAHKGFGAKESTKVGEAFAEGFLDGLEGCAESVEKTKVEIDMERKMSYIESAQVGTLVAFKLPGGRVKSAKIVKKSTKNRKFKLETDYGAWYIVPFDDIIWVRTGKRWPRGVYRLLKGLEEDGTKKESARATSCTDDCRA